MYIVQSKDIVRRKNAIDRHTKHCKFGVSLELQRFFRSSPRYLVAPYDQSSHHPGPPVNTSIQTSLKLILKTFNINPMSDNAV